MPFLLDAIRCVASSHLCRGICDRSKTVPVLTVNLPRQSSHMNIPACVLPPIFLALSDPHSGQTTPFGQRSCLHMGNGSGFVGEDGVCQVTGHWLSPMTQI